MLEKIRAGHFATLFSEGLEPEEAPPPPTLEPAREELSERVRQLASLLTRRPLPESLHTRVNAAT